MATPCPPPAERQSRMAKSNENTQALVRPGDGAEGLTTFTFADMGMSIRAGMDGRGAWVVGRDICKALNLTSRSSLAALSEDEKGVRIMDTPGGPQSFTIVYEPGVYQLVLHSRRPEAAAVRRWVCHEVLPSIRERGWYATHQPQLPSSALDADGTMTVTEAARVCATVCKGFRRCDAFSLLRTSRLIEKGSNAPTMAGIRRGIVVPKITTHTRDDGSEALNKQYAVLTPKGLAWLVTKAVAGAGMLPEGSC